MSERIIDENNDVKKNKQTVSKSTGSKSKRNVIEETDKVERTLFRRGKEKKISKKNDKNKKESEDNTEDDDNFAKNFKKNNISLLEDVGQNILIYTTAAGILLLIGNLIYLAVFNKFGSIYDVIKVFVNIVIIIIFAYINEKSK